MVLLFPCFFILLLLGWWWCCLVVGVFRFLTTHTHTTAVDGEEKVMCEHFFGTRSFYIHFAEKKQYYAGDCFCRRRCCCWRLADTQHTHTHHPSPPPCLIYKRKAGCGGPGGPFPLQSNAPFDGGCFHIFRARVHASPLVRPAGVVLWPNTHPPPAPGDAGGNSAEGRHDEAPRWRVAHRATRRRPHPTPAQPSPPTASLGSSDLGGNPFSPLFCAGFLDVATPPPPATYLCYQVLGTTLNYLRPREVVKLNPTPRGLPQAGPPGQRGPSA